MTKTSNNIDEINLPVRAVGVILDSATRALDWVREALHRSLSTTFFQCNNTRVSNTCQTRQKQSKLRDRRDCHTWCSRRTIIVENDNGEIRRASALEDQNLLLTLCVCDSGFGHGRLPNRSCTRSGHWRHGGSSPATASRHESSSRSL